MWLFRRRLICTICNRTKNKRTLISHQLKNKKKYMNIHYFFIINVYEYRCYIFNLHFLLFFFFFIGFALEWYRNRREIASRWYFGDIVSDIRQTSPRVFDARRVVIARGNAKVSRNSEPRVIGLERWPRGTQKPRLLLRESARSGERPPPRTPIPTLWHS